MVIPGFGIDVTQTDTTAVVCVVGELDSATAPHLQERIAGLTNSGVRAVTVDLAHLDFIDSTGLTALVSGLKRLRELGGDPALRSPKPSAMKLFDMTGLSAVFAIT